jgi:CBS domain-containing protein
MSHNTLSEDSVFFLPVEALCKGPAATCDPGMDVVAMARLMRSHDISSLVVMEGETVAGIVTIRDCRDLVADHSDALGALRVRDIMSTHLITLRRRDYVFDAIFKMSRHNIHRLIVLDDDGSLFGVVTDTDLVRAKTRTPLYLHQELESAQSIDHLRTISARMLDMVRYATRTGADIKSLIQLISHFNDAFTHRLIAILECDEGIRLPEGAAWLALGSEGRGEQTLRTDQDSAVVYEDDLSPEKRADAERFAHRLVDALEDLGVPRCPGNTMASNPQWRHTLSEWKELLNQWIIVPTPEHMVNFGMFQDLRILHGDEALERSLRDYVRETVQSHTSFLANMARAIVRFQPPLGMFGRIKVEQRGENRGKVDIKKAGIFALTVGTSLLALEAGIVGGSTWDKLEQLGKRGSLAPSDLETVQESFTYLVQLRLQRQLRALDAGNKPTNHVDPLIMTEMERDRFRQALKGAGTFLRIIRDHYQLDLVSR